jgi:uncharacterized protein (DUF1778 family)
MATKADDRIDVRISREQKELIKHASELSGFKSLSEFIVYCTSKEAKEVITEHNRVLKTLEDKRIFVETLLNPPAPNERLKIAHSNFLKYKSAHGAGNQTPEEE